MEETVRAFGVGDRVANYEIQDLSGAGAMGVVYRALDLRLECQVALKFLPHHLRFSEQDRKRLLHEARSAFSLDHPNIGVIHGIEETQDGQTFIVMTFYDGGTLSNRIISGPISLQDTVGFAAQIAQGMAEAHKHNIVHRDIKPSNIMLTKQQVVKIVDFGLALVLTDLSTRSLTMRGTAVYMAPEQINRRPADKRSDTWAVGVVLAEMLLGHHPFLRESWGATIYAILNDPPDSLDRGPADLQAIVFRALAKDPDKRYQDCGEMLPDLERISRRLQVTTGDPYDATLPVDQIPRKELERYAKAASGPYGYDTQRVARKRRRITLLIGALLLALIAPLGVPSVRQSIKRYFQKIHEQKAAYESYLMAAELVKRYDKPGNLDKAISELKSAVAHDPGFALGYAEIGEAYRLKYQQDRNAKWLDDAIYNCKIALSLDNGLSAVYATLGRIHNDAGNHDLAQTEFRRALELDPQNADALNGVAHIEEAAGQVKEAESTYRQAASLRADFWDSYNTLGTFYLRQHRLDDAITQLKKATGLTPDNSLAWANLGGAYLAYGRPQDRASAEQALQQSIAINPTYSAYANLGYLYLQQQRFAEAAETTRKALDINDQNFVVWENLERAYRRSGQPENAAAARQKARTLLEQAVRSSPRDAKVHAHLALLFARDGMQGPSDMHAQSAVTLAPGDPEVLLTAADSYAVLGNLTMAKKYIRQSLQHGYTIDDLVLDEDLKAVLKDPEFAVTKRK
jgi:serine/threonine-protein kinase